MLAAPPTPPSSSPPAKTSVEDLSVSSYHACTSSLTLDHQALLAQHTFHQTVSPPTPAASPLPWNPSSYLEADAFTQYVTGNFGRLTPQDRQRLLAALMPLLSHSDLQLVSSLISPLLKRDFLTKLPSELGLHILSFIDDPKDLMRAGRVSKAWRKLVHDDSTWKQLLQRQRLAGSTMGIPLSIQKSIAPLPGVLPMSRINALNGTSSPRRPALSASLGDTPGVDARAAEQWALQGLGLIRQTPVVGPSTVLGDAPVPAAGSLSPLAIRAPMPPLPPVDSASPIRQIGFDLPSIEAPLPIRPIRHLPPPVPTTGQRSPLVVQDDGPSAARRGSRTRSLPLPIPLPVNRPPTTTINFSPTRVFEAPTDARLRRQLRTAPEIADGSPPVSPPNHQRPSRPDAPASPSFPPISNPFGFQTRTSASNSTSDGAAPPHFSYQDAFKQAYVTESNWRKGPGRVLSTQQAADDGVVTSLCLDEEYVVVGMATNEVHVFDATDGSYARTLQGHTQGVWAVVLVSKTAPLQTGDLPAPLLSKRSSSLASATTSDADQGSTSRIMSDMLKQQGSICGTARGFGQKNALIVSGGCDQHLCVWDAGSGERIFALPGHTSTIRCLRVLDGRPIAISGSRDTTIRVWDIAQGKQLRVLRGHEHSVRCLDVSGDRVVSGSYDNTCRLWDMETGRCVFVYHGHLHPIYAVAFDGQRIASGSLDSTVRIWSAETDDCLALLQGHTSLVGQLQLTDSLLVTGGSDGRVIVFSLATLECLHRLCAHDNSVTCVQFDDRFIVTGGNDGRVKLFDIKTGQFIRELAEPCEAIWRIIFREDKCVILSRRQGRTTMSLLTFRPGEGEV